MIRTKFAKPAVSLVSAACLLAAAACGSGSDAGSSGSSIKILVSAPLTGDSAETGKEMLDGAKLAADRINAAGGIKSGPMKGSKLKIISANDENSTSAGTTIAQRYVNDKDTWAITGFLTSAVAQVAAQVSARADLTVFSTYGCAESLTTEVTNVALICGSGDYAGASAGKFVADQFPDATKVSILQNSDYSFLPTYVKGLKRELAANDISVVSEDKYPSNATSFASILTRTRQADPDVILMGDFEALDGVLVKQARSLGITLPMVDYVGAGLCSTYASTAGGAAKNTYAGVLGEAFPRPGSFAESVAAEWRSGPGKKSGKSVMTGAVMAGFDSVGTIAATIEAGAKDRTELKDLVPEARGDGLLGPIDFGTNLVPSSRAFQYTEFKDGASCGSQVVRKSYLAGVDGVEELK